MYFGLIDVRLKRLPITANLAYPCCYGVYSLFSMESASVFYSEEDDLRSWCYSKHLVEQERQEHIKRLREQGIIIPEEDLVDEKGAQLICSLCL